MCIRDRDKAEEDKANQYVIRAVEFIQRNYCNPVKVTDVADYVCINRSYLYTLFENSMGMSPQQFLTTYRITKAAELLAVTALPVESIALSCGYNDPLVFTKAFKQMKLPVSAKLIGQSKGIVLHHIPHTAVQLVRSLGMEYRMPYRKAHIGNKIFRTASGKTYPDISPGLLFIRLVKGKLSRSYEETASGFQRIFLARDAENPLDVYKRQGLLSSLFPFSLQHPP